MMSRWSVEVSRLGTEALRERYAVESAQWQAALKEARKVRGDLGPLSKFSIEVSEQGCTAVDPGTKVRYVVRRVAEPQLGAAQDSPRGQLPRAARAPALQPPALQPPALQPPALATPGAEAPAPPGPAPEAAATPAPVAGPRVEPTASVSSRPAEPALLTLLSSRNQDPTPESPIVYREVAYAVDATLPDDEMRRQALGALAGLGESVAERSERKFIQLALFDHHFADRPSRPPLLTLAWKDWRGAPVLHVRGVPVPLTAEDFEATRGTAIESVPPAPPDQAAAAKAVAEQQAAEQQAAEQQAAEQQAADRKAAQLAAEREAAARAIAEQQAAEREAAAREAAEREAAQLAAAQQAAEREAARLAAEREAAARLVAAQQAAAQQAAAEQAPRVASESGPPKAASASVAPERARPVTRPGAKGDLIVELFETMHDLRFMAGIAAGAHFVMDALQRSVPCRAAVIHVFDIDTRHFVVVRASGARGREAVLQRTSDPEGLFGQALRGTRSLHLTELAEHPRYSSELWSLLEVSPREVLCGPVQKAGRYLGIIELVNPEGAEPFLQTEVNALDYVCDLFAEFLASKPIVLERDVLLADG